MLECTWFSPATGKEWTAQIPPEDLASETAQAARHGIRLVSTRAIGWEEQLAHAESPDL